MFSYASLTNCSIKNLSNRHRDIPKSLIHVALDTHYISDRMADYSFPHCRKFLELSRKICDNPQKVGPPCIDLKKFYNVFLTIDRMVFQNHHFASDFGSFERVGFVMALSIISSYIAKTILLILLTLKSIAEQYSGHKFDICQAVINFSFLVVVVFREMRDITSIFSVLFLLTNDVILHWSNQNSYLTVNSIFIEHTPN